MSQRFTMAARPRLRAVLAVLAVLGATFGAAGAPAAAHAPRGETRVAELATPVTLGSAQGAPPNGAGFGQVRPTTISYGGDPTSLVWNIHWSSWGGRRAVGHGTADWIWPGWCVACASQHLRATVVAFSRGTCGGQPAYRRVEWFFPGRGMTFDPRLGSSDLCTGQAVPGAVSPKTRTCANVTFRNSRMAIGWAEQVQATGVGCRSARALIKLARPLRFAYRSTKFRLHGWYCGSEVQSGSSGPQMFDCWRANWQDVFFELVPL